MKFVKFFCVHYVYTFPIYVFEKPNIPIEIVIYSHFSHKNTQNLNGCKKENVK